MDLFSEMELLIIVKLSMSSAMSQVCAIYYPRREPSSTKTHIHCCQSRAHKPRNKEPGRAKKIRRREQSGMVGEIPEIY